MAVARIGSPGYHKGMATAELSTAAAPAPLNGTSAHFAYRFGTAGFALGVADDAAVEILESAYAPMRVASVHPTAARASIRRLSDGRLQVRYGRTALRFGSIADTIPLRAAYHAVREVFARFAGETPHGIAFYGALCALDGYAVLLLGPTTIGKTLLALHLAYGGRARFLGDDTALVSAMRDEAFAMPRRPSLRESALALLPDRVAQSIAACSTSFTTDLGRFWYALDAKALGGIEPCMQAYPLRAVCVLRARTERTSVRRIEPARGVKLAAQRAYARPVSLAQTALLRRALRRAAFFEVGLGAPEEAGELLAEELRSCV